jgi:poly(3-hydroxybutyrate) depolymerase
MDLADILGHTTENISATDLMLDFFDAHHRSN